MLGGSVLSSLSGELDFIDSRQGLEGHLFSHSLNRGYLLVFRLVELSQIMDFGVEILDLQLQQVHFLLYFPLHLLRLSFMFGKDFFGTLVEVDGGKLERGEFPGHVHFGLSFDVHEEEGNDVLVEVDLFIQKKEASFQLVLGLLQLVLLLDRENFLFVGQVLVYLQQGESQLAFEVDRVFGEVRVVEFNALLEEFGAFLKRVLHFANQLVSLVVQLLNCLLEETVDVVLDLLHFLIFHGSEDFLDQIGSEENFLFLQNGQ